MQARNIPAILKAELQRSDAVAKSLTKYHRLIYRVGTDERLKPLGTGLLLAVGDLRLLVTAAHVLEENRTGGKDFQDLVTYGQTQPVILRGESFRTTAPKSKSARRDIFDIGFIKLTEEAVTQIGEDRFWSWKNVDLDDMGNWPALYSAFGYPGCLNECLDPNSSSPINPHPFNYTAQFRPEKAHKKVGVSMGTHLLLAVSNRKARLNGQKAKLPDLHGMSGGGFWRLTAYTPDLQPRTPSLLGVTIEWHQRIDGGLLAARMGFVFEGLRATYPDLDQLLPRSQIASVEAEVATE